jgi:hypothetical protein
MAKVRPAIVVIVPGPASTRGSSAPIGGGEARRRELVFAGWVTVRTFYEASARPCPPPGTGARRPDPRPTRYLAGSRASSATICSMPQ